MDLQRLSQEAAEPKTCPDSLPLLMLLMKGHPGSGKSSLARCLARQLHLALADKDDARDCFQSRMEHSHAVDWNKLSYEVMFKFVATQLQNGMGVVVDCPLAHVHLYHAATSIATQITTTAAYHGSKLALAGTLYLDAGSMRSNSDRYDSIALGGLLKYEAMLVLVECECKDEGIWRARLDKRGTEDLGTNRCHKPTTWAQLQDLLTRYNDCWRWSSDGSIQSARHIMVDSSIMSPEEACKYVVAKLQEYKPCPSYGQ